ncbi:MAG: hypothetical protein KGL39_15160 [Patescibacteria group bacterium]|nr:hypothetical protein [Patescibacteria group bacterium]
MLLKFGKEALYERLLKEKDREIEILADQIDYLRAQLAMRGTHVPGAGTNPSGQPPLGQSLLPQGTAVEVKPYVSDEEIDAQVMLDNGEISKDQISEVLEALGLAPEFDLDNIDVSLPS